MLEYYNGILFLTTNRPGILDEAVTSRVHVSLRYPPLTEKQFKAIFQLNIERLKDIEDQREEAAKKAKNKRYKKLWINENEILGFADEHFRKGMKDIDSGREIESAGPWNGRQIRNAFLIAASLAHYQGDKETDPNFPKTLGAEQFRKVEATTQAYAKYRVSTIGKSDSERALELEERNDTWSPANERKRSVYANTRTSYPGSYNSFQPHPQGAGWDHPNQPQVAYHQPVYPPQPTYIQQQRSNLSQTYQPRSAPQGYEQQHAQDLQANMFSQNPRSQPGASPMLSNGLPPEQVINTPHVGRPGEGPLEGRM